MPEPPKKGGAGGRVYLYVLDAGDLSKVIKRYEIPAGGWGWRGFEVEVRGVKGEYLIAFGSRRAWGWSPIIYLTDLEVESAKPASPEIDDLIRVANKGDVAVKVRLRLVSGHGLWDLRVALGETVQIAIEGGRVVSGVGDWVLLRPKSHLPISVACRGMEGFSYRVLVEAVSVDGAEMERLELTLKSP